jgi:hypothetical protein
MINRIFIIAKSLFWSGIQLPEEENIYLSILIDPSREEELEYAYHFMSGIHQPAFILTLDLKEPLTEAAIRFVTSFVFLPAYRHRDDQVVINLTGNRDEIIEEAAKRLSQYLELQDKQVMINKAGTHDNGEGVDRQPLFCQADELLEYYKDLLRQQKLYDNDIFFLVTSAEVYYSTLTAVKKIAAAFRQEFPALYSLVIEKERLEREAGRLKKKSHLMEAELDNQRQYTEILRSDNAARELQQYYDREYEVLPTWYKRFGHIVKVMMGKRTFRSLFRDDVKKYKD